MADRSLQVQMVGEDDLSFLPDSTDTTSPSAAAAATMNGSTPITPATATVFNTPNPLAGSQEYALATAATPWGAAAQGDGGVENVGGVGRRDGKRVRGASMAGPPMPPPPMPLDVQSIL